MEEAQSELSQIKEIKRNNGRPRVRQEWPVADRSLTERKAVGIRESGSGFKFPRR